MVRKGESLYAARCSERRGGGGMGAWTPELLLHTAITQYHYTPPQRCPDRVTWPSAHLIQLLPHRSSVWSFVFSHTSVPLANFRLHPIAMWVCSCVQVFESPCVRVVCVAVWRVVVRVVTCCRHVHVRTKGGERGYDTKCVSVYTV